MAVNLVDVALDLPVNAANLVVIVVDSLVSIVTVVSYEFARSQQMSLSSCMSWIDQS